MSDSYLVSEKVAVLIFSDTVGRLRPVDTPLVSGRVPPTVRGCLSEKANHPEGKSLEDHTHTRI
jgi:hypothetical protein